MQTITLEQVKAKAREYYLANNLIAQHGPVKVVGYRLGEYRCAIAAALDLETIVALEGRLSLGYTVPRLTKGLVKVKSPTKITKIQMAHDMWAMGSGTEQAFKALIGL